MKNTTAAEAAAGRLPGKSGQAVGILLWCLLGLLVPRATLYGEMAPFGVSLAAAAGEGGIPVMLAAVVGYLLAGSAVYPLRYVLAVAVVGGGRWVLSALADWHEKTAFPPLLAFFATASTGLIMSGAGRLDFYRVLLILAESAVAAGCSLFFRAAVRLTVRREDKPVLTGAQQASVILTGAVVIMAASTVSVGDFVPGRALAVVLVLVLARSGREPGGCMAGVILGTAVALGTPGLTVTATALAFGGLIAGVFSRFGRPAQAASFLIAAGVMMLAETGEDSLIHIYEMLVGGLVFILIPREWDRRLGHLFIRSRDLPAVEGLRRAAVMRLRVAANAMQDVAQTVTAVSDRLAQYSSPDTAAVLRVSRAAVCGSCPMVGVCWEQHAEEMTACMERMAEELRQNGFLTPGQLTGQARQCRQKERLTEHITRGYEQYLARESAWRRLGEIQGSIHEQFGGMGDLLTAIAADLEDPRQVDIELSERVLAVCTDYGMPVREALCSRGGNNRLTVDIITADVGVRLDGGRWLKDIQQACGRTFAPPSTADCGRDIRITLTEQPRYVVESGAAQLCADGEKLCGDAMDIFSDGGRTVAMISDGMGSGGRAAVDGAMTVGLTSRLWKAGFRPDSILQTVNASLLVKSREESLSTLDIAAVDEFSGRLDCYKAGAAASLLRSGGRVSRVEKTSLPIGILPDIAAEHCHDWLAAEDILLIMSDGALAAGSAPVEEILKDHPDADSMQMLAERVAAFARQAPSPHTDDVTVIALRLHPYCPPQRSEK